MTAIGAEASDGGRLSAVGVGFGLAVIVGSFAASVALPLATYTLALAVFGLAHVTSELRFVDRVWSARLWRALPALGLLLLAGCAARAGGVAGLVSPEVARLGELGAGAGLVFATLPLLRRGELRIAAAVLGLGLVAATAASSTTTLVVFAILHNLTPIALVGAAVAPARRRATLAATLAVFLGLPAAILTGLPGRLAAGLPAAFLDLSPFPVGPLDGQLGVWVPAALLDGDHAIDVFSAAVFAQCMHYAAVIHLLPRLMGRGDTGVLRWPRGAGSVVLLVGPALVLGLVFAVDFGLARRLYGLAAMVHAWIEIPVLLVLLDRSGRSEQQADPGRGGIGERGEPEAA